LIPPIFLVSLLSFPCLVSLGCPLLIPLIFLVSLLCFSCLVKHNKETKKMRGIKSGQSRDTRHGKHNKETKKMRGIKSGQSRDTRHGKLCWVFRVLCLLIVHSWFLPSF
jgi:hypothetical protein